MVAKRRPAHWLITTAVLAIGVDLGAIAYALLAGVDVSPTLRMMIITGLVACAWGMICLVWYISACRGGIDDDHIDE